jgi:hypothetical protein
MRLTESNALVTVSVSILLTVTVLTAQPNNPLTNADVRRMVKAGLAEPAIVAAIAANDTQFDLSSTGLQALNQASASSTVIRAMLAAVAKKKNAAEATENSTAAQAGPAAQDPSPDTSDMSPRVCPRTRWRK